MVSYGRVLQVSTNKQQISLEYIDILEFSVDILYKYSCFINLYGPEYGGITQPF
uniref:Uncharacterized protein n=1 Tax=Arion vulgaris TaxID=1028688 RepID=A0A0B7BAM2_9EUPU